MSYVPQRRVHYQVAEPGEITNGLTVQVVDRPGGRAAVLFEPGECASRLAGEISALSTHQSLVGSWRQKWTHDGRMSRPAQGYALAVTRWERIPGHLLPAGRTVVAVEQARSCVFLVNEDECRQSVQNDMNDLMMRMVGDGLWIQVWFSRRPLVVDVSPGPLLTPLRTPA